MGPEQPAERGYPEDSYADVPGARLRYIDTGGTGVPVVFMHAATGSSRSWEHQVPAFIAAGYRLIAFDRRGRGRTQPVAATGPQPGTGAGDLLALADCLGIGRFHLAGTAAGGFTVLDFAVSWPERLHSIVVANSIYGIQDPDFLELTARLRPQPVFNQLPPDFRELGPSYRAAQPEGTRRWLAIEQCGRPPEPMPPQPTRNRLTLALMEAITTPALLITGGADLYAPPPVQRLIADRIRHAKSMVIAEAGHSAHWEEPETFNRAVLSFMQRVDGQP